MRPVAVRILHPGPSPDAGPLERWLADARAGLAERHRTGFVAAGADDVRVVTGPPDDTPFGRRLRDLVRADRPAGGLVVLGSGAVPLATLARPARLRRGRRRRRPAGARQQPLLGRHRRDRRAPPRGSPTVPDLAGDNALPRWLDEVAGYAVTDLRGAGGSASTSTARSTSC